MTRFITRFAARQGKPRITEHSKLPRAPIPRDLALAAFGVPAPEFL